MLTHFLHLTAQLHAANLADLMLYDRPDTCPHKVEARAKLNTAKAAVDACAWEMRKGVVAA